MSDIMPVSFAESYARLESALILSDQTTAVVIGDIVEARDAKRDTDLGLEIGKQLEHTEEFVVETELGSVAVTNSARIVDIDPSKRALVEPLLINDLAARNHQEGPFLDHTLAWTIGSSSVGASGAVRYSRGLNAGTMRRGDESIQAHKAAWANWLANNDLPAGLVAPPTRPWVVDGRTIVDYPAMIPGLDVFARDTMFPVQVTNEDRNATVVAIGNARPELAIFTQFGDASKSGKSLKYTPEQFSKLVGWLTRQSS